MENILQAHEKQWQQLLLAKQNDRLAHAYLFAGIKGLGKLNFATQFAKLLLCKEANSCGKCHACLLFAAHSHPDLLIIAAENVSQTITVDQIRTVTQCVNETALLGGKRVIIINPATAMNASAANALLKTLEEPTPNTFFILVHDLGARLPATILSRCQKIIFKNSQDQQITPWVHKETCYQGLFEIALKKVFPLQISALWYEFEALPLIDLLLDAAMDILRWQITADTNAFNNKDHKKNLMLTAQQTTCDKTLNFLDYLQHVRKIILSGIPLNKQLTMDEILIRWKSYATR